MSTAPELRRSPSYREVGAGIALASVALSSCHWWFSFSPFNHILRHLMERVLGGEELHLMFSFLLLTLLHVQISFLWSSSSRREMETCVVWVLNSVTAANVVTCSGYWPRHCGCSCVYHISRHNSLNTFSPNEFNLTKKELTTECVRDNMLGNLGPEKSTILSEDHMTPYFENGHRKGILQL